MPDAAPQDTAPTSDFHQRALSGVPLVHYAVNDLAVRLPNHITHDDLMSAGMLGLAQAAKSWDESRGVTFERYARTRIKGALLDELRSRDWATRSVRAKARHLQAAVDTHTRATGVAPTTAEIAAELGMTTTEVSKLTADVHRTTVLHFDAIFTDAEDNPLPSPEATEPAEALLHRELIGYLRDAITCLPERLRTVVVQYFFEERQMQDIAVDLGVTESRVSQLRAEAIALLRSGLDASLGTDAPADAAVPIRRTRRTSAYLAEVASASDCKTRLSAAAMAVPSRAHAVSA